MGNSLFSNDTATPVGGQYYGNYNLIYGDWVITDYISGGKNFNEAVLKTYTGTELKYRYDSVQVGEAEYYDPIYIPHIIAMADRMEFLGGDHYPENSEDVFDVNSAYFVALDVQCKDSDSDALISGLIIIKSNDRLILKTDVGYCVLERLGFVEDKDAMIPHI